MFNLENIIKNYKLEGGSWNEDKIEQELCIKYINSNHNVYL